MMVKVDTFADASLLSVAIDNCKCHFTLIFLTVNNRNWWIDFGTPCNSIIVRASNQISVVPKSVFQELYYGVIGQLEF